MKYKDKIDEAKGLVMNRMYQEAIELYKEIIENSSDDDQSRFWAMKHLADTIGYIGYKDYFSAIDIYQSIINDYELEDDLYEWCQLDIMRSYLEMGMDMFSSFDNMQDIIMPKDDTMDEYLQKILERKEQFIETEAEKVYKKRM